MPEATKTTSVLDATKTNGGTVSHTSPSADLVTSVDVIRQAGLVDIAIPVYNEQVILGESIRKLHAFLESSFPFDFRITIVDNASTDRTWEFAQELSRVFDRVHAIHLTQKGKGLAVRSAWADNDAEVVAYMDVDLSTGLEALSPLVASLFSQHSDIAIGTRLARGSAVTRGPKREAISRIYNKLIQVTMAAGFSDAQCGFKAARADVIDRLLPEIHDDGWFFDTELLLLAEASGYRVFEIPVSWIDNPDTRVGVIRTANNNLKGMLEVARRAFLGEFYVDHVVQTARSLRWQIVVFAIVGILSTLMFAVIYLGLRGIVPVVIANCIASLATAIANTAANRRFTFGIRGPSHRLRQQIEAGVAYIVSLALTTAFLILLKEFAPDSNPWVEIIAVLCGTFLATILRFVLLREWVFSPRQFDRRKSARA